eukprot:4292783-Pleurochrysis_carterae.AAC.7
MPVSERLSSLGSPCVFRSVACRAQPVAGSVKRRVWLPDGALQQPPVVLLTTVAHFDDGAAADGADRGPRPRR